MPKVALITGITGQDGSYLAELLLEKGYDVWGMVRRSSIERLDRIRHIRSRVKIVGGDLTDQSSLDGVVKEVKPDEVYNLASQSFVPTSFKEPELTMNVTGVGVVRMLEAIRKYDKNVRFYQASSSEMYGNIPVTPQDEDTPFAPRSPYGTAKVCGHYTTINYRQSYGMFAVSGICFNHESERRGIEFVSRKITNGVARIKLGLDTELKLGNLDAKRDWGHAADFVEAMWLMLQQDEPRDYVIATGVAHSVRDFVRIAFEVVGLDYQKHVTIDKQFYRPSDVNHLLGNSYRALKQLDWKPKIAFETMIQRMVSNDVSLLEREERQKLIETD